MVKIKKACGEDLEVIIRLINELSISIDSKFQIQENQYNIAIFTQLLQNKDYTVFISIAHKQSGCGIIILNEGISPLTKDKFGRIKGFYVDDENLLPDTGMALLKKTIDFAQNNNWAHIEVTSNPKEQWNRAYDFYLKKGFVETGNLLKLKP